MTDNPNIWYAVFVDPRGKQFHGDDTYRTVYFDFNRSRTPPELAREALGKRYPEIADSARMVELAAWGIPPTNRQHSRNPERLPPGQPFATFP